MNSKDCRKCQEINGWFDTLVCEPISLIFAKWFAKHGFHPNTVTCFSIFFGVIGAAFLACPNPWITLVGVLLEIFGYLFDCADGQVARMTGKGTKFGRLFDGAGDTIVYTSIYIGIGIKMMRENIFFTNTQWGWWAWLVVVPIALFFHRTQCSVADYAKQIHMYFTKTGHAEFQRSENLDEYFASEKTNFFKRLVIANYVSYTKGQERSTPHTQALANKVIKENNNVVPEKVQELYTKHYRLAKYASYLVFNCRSYVLFALLLVGGFTGYGLTAWIFVFDIVVLEPLALIIQFGYEKVAKQALKEGFDK